MPKGDLEHFIADCDDGYTKIPNLLLEALPLARLTGVQKSICMFLWRRTYGWKRNEDAISMGEFAMACGSSRPYISLQLNDLINKNVISRVFIQPGKTAVYSFNANLNQWDPACVDLDALSENALLVLYHYGEFEAQGLHESTTPVLHESITPVLYKSITPVLHESITVNQPSTQYLPGFETPLKKD